MVLDKAAAPLCVERRPCPRPGCGEILIAVQACGVRRTDLHIVDGELASPKSPLIPEHEVEGRVAALEVGVAGHMLRKRVGAPLSTPTRVQAPRFLPAILSSDSLTGR
ncbi:alcohol dehydrogenase catalytic domain-containing protein [Alsobacter sp. KACC 23698]|uniref:Alcohol dehydrogenase catalytic domain-containing protein n=1 Tax=Alsobacter sp. KACC 23698 TaxID=3149229 RepID=A0AAU7JFG9_9HYPH